MMALLGCAAIPDSVHYISRWLADYMCYLKSQRL